MRSGASSAILSIALMACGRIDFAREAVPDAAPDAELDAAPIARCNWSAGPPFTSPPVLRPDLSMPDTEYDPFLVPGDPLTINYVARIGASGELFEAHRASTSAPFDAPVMRTDLSSPSFEESALALEAGGLRGYYVSNTSGASEIYEVTRASTADPLTVVRVLDELGTTGARFDPWPFANGLGLVYTDQPPAQTTRVMFASRATTADRWSNLVPSQFNGAFAGISGATVTTDGLVMVFSATGAGGDADIFYATRGSISDVFGPARPLAITASANGEYEPSLRDDGCELFLARDSGAGTKWDIYSVPAVAP